jgi:uncharacterized Zn finger protein
MTNNICPSCGKHELIQQEYYDDFYDCPACGEIFQDTNGKFYWTDKDGFVTEDEIKPKVFLFRESGLNLNSYMMVG